MGKLNTVKMSVIPIFLIRFNALGFKVILFVFEFDNQILKFVRTGEERFRRVRMRDICR